MTTQVVDLGYRPRSWQAAVHRALVGVLFAVLLVHRRGGKTLLCVMELVTRALDADRTDWRGAYIAPYLKQAKDIAWAYLKQYAGKVPGAKISESELTVTLPNKAGGWSRISLYGADNPDAMRGIYLDFAVLDELAQMKPETWHEVVSVALLDRGGGAIFIGTVKGYTLLSKLYREALKDGTGKWLARNYTWRETMVFSDEELNTARSNMSEAQFRQEFENDDTVASDKQILPMSLVLPAVGKILRPEQYEYAPKILGVDVAFSEVGDRAVIFPRQGLASFDPVICRGEKNPAFARRVAEFYSVWEADAIMIGAGRAEGVIHYLQEMNLSPMVVPEGSGNATKPEYGNLRVQLWDDGIKPWLEQGGALPPDVPGLVEDLVGPCFRPDSQTGKLYMETADQMKARGLMSPDLGMALSFTFAYPIRKRPDPLSPLEARIEARYNRAVTDPGDPLEGMR